MSKKITYSLKERKKVCNFVVGQRKSLQESDKNQYNTIFKKNELLTIRENIVDKPSRSSA